MNTPVSFPLAKLLKEKGFEGTKSPLWYYKDGTLHETPTKGYKGLKSWNSWEYTQGIRWDAPNIAEVVMWIYKNHKIWISVDPENDINNTWFHTISHGTSTTIFGNYSSPTEAYEAGIEDVLINMI